MDASNDLKKLDNVAQLEKDVFTFLCPFRLIIYGVSVCACVDMRPCVYVCVRACVCVYVCVCVCSHAFVYVCVYVYFYQYFKGLRIIVLG